MPPLKSTSVMHTRQKTRQQFRFLPGTVGAKKSFFQVGAAFGLVDSQFSHKGMLHMEQLRMEMMRNVISKLLLFSTTLIRH